MLRRSLLLALLLLALPAAAYDPSTPPGPVSSIDLSVDDAARHRDIPLKVYLPSSSKPRPVIVFSHGLGGSREGYAYLGRAWAQRGYVVVHLQHHGSDDAVWRKARLGEKVRAMTNAASAENHFLRTGDVKVTLDQLTKWNDTQGHALFHRLDLEHVGMAGHSFGAITTQALSGQQASTTKGIFTERDPRILAAIAMSPSPPKSGTPEEAFGAVSIPWLLMTGTLDKSPIGNIDAASRLRVFPALPAGHKYELVLDRAEHSAFSDRALPGDTEPRNLKHQVAIVLIGTAFWDAYLGNDAGARAWLDGAGPRSILEAGDRWTRN